MKTNYIFTYIIAYRHNQERLQNLKKVLDWVNGFSNVEIILVEQDKHSKISHLNLDVNKHIFIKSDKSFNRSWAFNVGLKYSTTDIIVFGDCDIIMVPQDFVNGLLKLKEYDVVSPYDTVLDLTMNESNLLLSDIIKINREGRGENDNQKINLCGGITFFNKSAIMKIGGWCEDIFGWGCEDNICAIMVENLLNYIEIKNVKCYHLYHGKAKINMEEYQKNINILNNFNQMSKEQLQKYAQLSLPKIGNKNLLT